MNTTKTLIYLATPYSHTDAEVRERRFKAVNQKAAELMRQGLHIYSPISHTHPIALAGELPLGWDYWQDYDRAMLNACCKLMVLKLDGWSESKGVLAEIKIADELGLPVEFLEPSFHTSALTAFSALNDLTFSASAPVFHTEFIRAPHPAAIGERHAKRLQEVAERVKESMGPAATSIGRI